MVKQPIIKKAKGLTLIEMIIAIAIFMILAGVGVGAYFGYYVSSLRSNEINNAIGLMKQARFKAMKNPTNANYGFHLDANMGTVTIFREVYNANNEENIVLKLDHSSLSDINLAPSPGVTTQVLFEKQTGKTENSGTFVLGDGDFSRIMNINSQGLVE